MAEISEKQIKQLIERRHPEYVATKPHWDFLEACYRGGRSWFDGNIFRYIKEGDKEYKERLERAYRFNHSREIVDLLNKYIFKGKVERNRKDASPAVRAFWDKATRNGQPITDFMRELSLKSSNFGRIWVVVDNTKSQAPVQSQADAKKAGLRSFAYFVRPQDALDMSYDTEGNLNWILIREVVRLDDNPFSDGGEVVPRYRLWTRDFWMLFGETKKGNKTTYDIIDTGEHGLGVVPVFSVDNIVSDSLYTAPSLIGDIAYLDRAVANYLSNLDAIIQDQTFSQLAMPAQGLMPGEEGYEKLLEMGTKRIFLFDGEGGVRPEYLSPDPKQAELIVMVIRQIINEIYHSVGLAGERTKQDNAVGIDNSSGVAKAYDFERVNALLTSKADALDRAEAKLVELVKRWNGEDPEDHVDLVKYPDDFDIRGLYDEFDIASRLSLLQAPATVRQEQMKLLVEKLFPKLPDDLLKKMQAEIVNWANEGSQNISTPSLMDTSNVPGPKENRQGQVTDQDTGQSN